MTKMLGKFKQLIIGILIGATVFSGTTAFAAYGTNITAYFQPLKYYVDGVQKHPPAGHEGFIYKNTTYVPLRFVAESLDQDVTWNQSKKTIHMENKKAKPDPVPAYSANDYLFGDIYLGMTKSEVKADESKYNGQLLEETSSSLLYYSSYPVQDTTWETAIQYEFEGGKMVRSYVILDYVDYLSSTEMENLFFSLEYDLEAIHGTSDYYDYDWYNDDAGSYMLWSLWQGTKDTPSIFVSAERDGGSNTVGIVFDKNADYQIMSESSQASMQSKLERLQNDVNEKDTQPIEEENRR